MRARISIIGTDVLCECDSAGGIEDARIPLTEETLSKLDEWNRQYRGAVRSRDPSMLLGLGAGMFDWLDEAGWASGWTGAAGERVLEVAVDDVEHDAARGLLDLPWETLTRKGDFLAADDVQPFVVFRSIGRHAEAEPTQPTYRDLTLMFMAAAPEGLTELNYEAEEVAILGATKRLPVQVVVEESGCKDFLKDRLAQDGPFEVVHISCHGDVIKNAGPVLALETPEGDLALTNPGDFARVLGERKPPLVFLSACRTALAVAENGTEAVESFVRALVRAGVANVLGWDGSVHDSDAIDFARSLYNELAGYASVPFAAATARRDLLTIHRNDRNKGRHWHLARVYAGPDGTGQCCDRALPKRHLRKEAGFKEFLDKANSQVPVATAQEFVGRRRQAQAVLRAFQDGGKAGVLIFGMGNLGKSSLAARVANRMPNHKTVVVWQRYDALAVFDQLVAALPGSERDTWASNWRANINRNGAALGWAVEEMLEGPFDSGPILLIIDDLEQILEPPRPEQTVTRVQDGSRVSLAAVLGAFTAANTESRLLLTSRYDFSLPDGKGGDGAAKLERVPLHSMDEKERAKQWRAAEVATGRAEDEKNESATSLVTRAQVVAGGNPGLQEILCRPILSGELQAAGNAVDAVEGWKASGEIPKEENAAQEFFRRVSFETYRNALTEPQGIQLRAGTLFTENLPVPMAALRTVGLALGVAEPQAAISRLVGLGLVDHWGGIGGFEHAAVNPLARPLAGDCLAEIEQRSLAAAAIEPISEAWRSADGDFPFDARGVEAARLALASNARAEVLDAAAHAAGSFLFRREHDAWGALAVLLPALEKIRGQGEWPQPGLSLVAADCAERIGETELRISILEQGLALPSGDKVEQAHIAVKHAAATSDRDGLDKALQRMRDAADVCKEAGDERSYAVTMGWIAEILEKKGETVEALRIRSEEELPVYGRLGDVRSCALTKAWIADILRQRGETDEALRIYLEEVIPVYKRLGDVRERAVAIGKVAEMQAIIGDIDLAQALRIWTEECLSVFQRLGDIGSIAFIRFVCARARLHRGGLEPSEAQTVLDELKESFAINRKLQLLNGIADVGQWLGHVLAEADFVDEALDVLDQSAAAFEKLNRTNEAAKVREMQEQIRRSRR